MGQRFETDEELREDEYNDARMHLDPWFDNINLGKIDIENIRGLRDDLQNVFEFIGGNMDISNENREILKLYMPGEASDGMEAVWGDRKLDEFDAFLTRWIADYNAKEGNRRLPKTDSRDMGVGMKRFFLETTQLSLGLIDEETYKLRNEAAIKNGIFWQEHRDDERITLPTPKSGNKSIKVSVIAPGFASDFYDWLRTSPR